MVEAISLVVAVVVVEEKAHEDDAGGGAHGALKKEARSVQADRPYARLKAAANHEDDMAAIPHHDVLGQSVVVAPQVYHLGDVQVEVYG